jgi:hypothetical protein
MEEVLVMANVGIGFLVALGAAKSQFRKACATEDPGDLLGHIVLITVVLMLMVAMIHSVATRTFLVDAV